VLEEYLERSMTYADYLKLIDDLLSEGKTTGPKQSSAMFDYAKLNRQRMHRLEKTVELEESVVSAAKGAKRRVIWLVITEGWCGDAAQNIPIIEKIAAQSVNIETRYILRDENPDLMDMFLTNGKRSIPKLIAMDAATREALGSWGSRPAPAQGLFNELKAQGIAKPLISENMQRWYNADRGKTIQAEFVELIEQGEGSEQGVGEQVLEVRA
jgi:thioredoxin family protein